jgi:hypothetical protein
MLVFGVDGGCRLIKNQQLCCVNAVECLGDLFILDGQKVLVADMGEPFVSDYGRPDRRLREVYGNATESDLLLRSLQRALNKDKSSRRITNPDLGPLFSHIEAEDDLPTGYIYVLWFLVPLEVIEEVIKKIKEGTIDQFRYDPKTANLTRS